MVDFVKIQLSAGNGGDGRISFFRNRYQPKGGPDGGDGGKGGSVIVKANPHLATLRDYAGKQVIAANHGGMGGKEKMHGADADDIILSVPVGTRIWSVIDTYSPIRRKRMYTVDRDTGRTETPIYTKSHHTAITQKNGVFGLQGASQSARGIEEEAQAGMNEEGTEVEEVTQSAIDQTGSQRVIRVGSQEFYVRLVGDVIEEDQTLCIAKGGKGGQGNFEFRSSRNTTPRQAETGEDGERGLYIFELQLLADIGLVGLPNAGKSTLLSVLTNASPKIANYPFTTIEPNLGVITFDSKYTDRHTAVIADIPGIIEGASEGKGLGHEFLRHIARCDVLVFVLALEDSFILENSKNTQVILDELIKQYRLLEKELSSYVEAHPTQAADEYGVAMDKKERVIVLNKRDLLSEDQQQDIFKGMKGIQPTICWTSGVTQEGIEELKKLLVSKLR